MHHLLCNNNILRRYLFVEVAFAAPHAGLKSIRVGSASLNTVLGNRFDVAARCLLTLLRLAAEMKVDIIGVDLRSAKSECHGISPIRYAFMQLGEYRADQPHELLAPGTQDESVGFLFPTNSKLCESCALTGLSYFSVLNNDIGLCRSDERTHCPVVAHFRTSGEVNRRQRNPETEMCRKQRSSRGRRLRKQAEARQEPKVSQV